MHQKKLLTMKKWITKGELLKSVELYGKSPYGEHLRRVAENSLIF